MHVLRSADRLLLVWALLVAVLLHLPAHVGAGGREALVEDGPVLVSNPAFDRFGAEGLGDVVLRAATDPVTAWGAGDGSIGRSVHRPASRVAAAIEHGLFRGATAKGAAVVSLLLHLAVVAATISILQSLDAPRASRWLAATVVAANPAALAVAAWPARQSVALATALGLGACALAVRGGLLRHAAAGALLLLAALSHETGYGLGLACIVLVSAGGAARSPARAWLPAAGLLVAVALRVRALAGGETPATAGVVPGPFDGAAGMLHAAVSLVLPARLHFADGPWMAATAARAGAVLVLVAGTWGLARTASPAARLGLCALAALSPVLALGLTGPSGAPFHDGMLYAAAPFGAAAVAWAVASALAAGGSLRVGAAAAGALWAGAAIAGTAVRAPEFRTRSAHVRLAEREMPDSPVVQAWALDATAASMEALPPAQSADPAPWRAIAARAEALGRSVTAPGAADVSRDPVAATTVSSALTRVARAVALSPLAPGDEAHEAASAAADAATKMTPGWALAWSMLATSREREGALGAAYDAAVRAGELAQRHPDTLVAGVRISGRVGNTRLAAVLAETMLIEERTLARSEGRAPRPEILLRAAQAFTDAGSDLVPDMLDRRGLRRRFEIALEILRELSATASFADAVRHETYRACLLYGDFLTSADVPSLALLAYDRAASAGVRDSEAAEHRGWLGERLQREEREAGAAVAAARTGEGNMADALVALARACGRQNRWQEAENAFSVLERDLGMPAVLRYHRAMILWRHRDPERAIEEITSALRDDPSIARAHFDLGVLLEEERGDWARSLESYRTARRLAVEQAATQGADDWLLDADDRFETVEQVIRDLAGAR